MDELEEGPGSRESKAGSGVEQAEKVGKGRTPWPVAHGSIWLFPKNVGVVVGFKHGDVLKPVVSEAHYLQNNTEATLQ